MTSHLVRPLRALFLAGLLALLGACGGGQPGTATPVESAKADAVAFNGNGSWWNPTQSGSGFFFEAQGVTGIVTFYMYEADGRSVWYAGAGTFAPVAGGKHQFNGTLQRFKGGQPSRSLTTKPATGEPAGAVAITFDGFNAQGTVAGRNFTAQKFFQGGANATASQPETGIYWNPLEPGRGFTIEVNNNLAIVAVFHYATGGDPIWHMVAVPLNEKGGASSGDFVTYAGGQTLSGAYKPPASSAKEGRLSLDFSAPCVGQLAFPDLPAIGLRRVAFGSLPAGAECRQAGAAPQADRQAPFIGTWVGCFVGSSTQSRRETYFFERKDNGVMALRFGTTSHATADCSGPGTSPTEDALDVDFRPNVSSVIEGVVMHRIQGVVFDQFKRVIGIQANGQLRVGVQENLPEDGFATKLYGLAYQKQ